MPGKLVLIGAGPGDPKLLTLRAVEALKEADVVLKDRLVPDTILEEAGCEAEVIDVGKKPGGGGWTQEEINEKIVEEGSKGRTVARLKSGDPLVFGRGAEEIEVALEAGMNVEVIPGVTSAIGVPSRAGLPLTHRRYASSFAVATGHEDPSKSESRVDFKALKEAADTLVVLMGAGRFKEIAEDVAEASGENTPVAVIEKGTTEDEKIKVGTVKDVLKGELKADPPAIIVFGDVVGWWRDVFGL